MKRVEASERIVSVYFQNYKALADYQIRLKEHLANLNFGGDLKCQGMTLVVPQIANSNSGISRCVNVSN
jgi:hypothetical protein